MTHKLLVQGTLFAAGADAEELEGYAYALRAELEELAQVQRVDAGPGGKAPAGSKSADFVDVTTFVIQLLGSGGALSLIKLLSDWVMRNHRVVLKLKSGKHELELKGGSPALAKEAVEAWAKRVSQDEDGE